MLAVSRLFSYYYYYITIFAARRTRRRDGVILRFGVLRECGLGRG